MPPLDVEEVRTALSRLRTWPLLTGFRGLLEIDLSPVMVSPDRVSCVDAKIRSPRRDPRRLQGLWARWWREAASCADPPADQGTGQGRLLPAGPTPGPLGTFDPWAGEPRRAELRVAADRPREDLEGSDGRT